MPNKLTAAIVALVLVAASQVPSADATPIPYSPTPVSRPASAVRLDAFGMASLGLHRLGAFLIALDKHNRDVWTFTARAHEAEADAARRAGTSTTSSTAVASSSASTSGACGGDLPPCYVMMRESGGNIRAQNPTSSASGKWQILDSTWGGFMGYARAGDAPEWVQDAKARTMALCNWQPPNYCA